MAANSNSTLEMGTSDQILVTTKKSNKLKYTIGFIAMLAVIGAVVALVVVLSGNEGGDADEQTTTDGPTPVTTPSTTTLSTTSSTTSSTTTTELPVTDPPTDLIDLEDVINGVFAPTSFNGTWISGNKVLYRSLNDGLLLYNVDTDSPIVLVANSSQILQQSSRVTSLSPDQSNVVLAYNVEPEYRHSFLARYSAINTLTGEIEHIAPVEANATRDFFLQNFIWGPSGTSLAFVHKNDIYYKENISADAIPITTNGEEYVIYNGIPDWVYEEEVFGSNNAMWFSADGTKLAYATFNDTEVRIMKVPHYGVPGSVYYQYTQHKEIRYPKPGTANPVVSVTIRDFTSTASTTYPAPTNFDDPILRTVRFVTNDQIAVMWTNRVQTSLSVNLCTLGNSVCSTIYEYSEPNGWIDNIPLLFNEEGNSFVTILPMVPYKQLVQVSQPTGAETTWTAASRSNPGHTVLDIIKWTPDDTVWYKATHVNDSAEQHIYTVNSDNIVNCFTCTIQKEDGDPCLYNEAALSPDASRVTINCAGPGVPQVLIYNSNGTLVRSWDDNAETAAMVESRTIPSIIRMQVPVADGLPEADVHIQVPPDYASRTNVPLLVYVYGGPDSALVTKQWGIDWGTSLVSRWNIAVAIIDGRGSGLRGVSNTFALNRQLGSVEVEDQIQVTKYLQQLPWVDANRTCIWGWSYGGYASSLALARGGDVFRCAIAVAPVVDWRFYDTIYTERYMDLPQVNTEAYTNSSLLTQEVVDAYRNKRYFLVHGTADDNVHYQHAMLFSRLLQRRDVYFTQMSYTDEDHSLVGVRPHLYHALEKFLRDNML
ncbi:venom dipeptidyl peptidase 4-like [Hyposmocoma kahamanoa]|uniref:venom dipeptidyl peptidase 4-like n=1 Tax=Hyposmocoma kahamanoa TaxID=1477025 RepID=UPI000E6D9D3F|nr:venom dipeptidyl peptidase 4-like [Hyposmocoma kahamanoa]XP_026313821.1 venom dipeptidyl peptidase 4-like [Hyposmocoma kahamanoa]XP_026313822.1 venom dipeptidyl peptidase 4-like [Hyposmocoma kahamanoa]